MSDTAAAAQPTTHPGTQAATHADTQANTQANTLPDWVHRYTSALDEKMGFELLELTPERVVGRAPVEGNTQPIGLWHGGASCVMAETLGSMGAAAHAMPERFAVGVDINATHHRSARSGWVTGTATALKLGRSVAMYEIVLVDDAGSRICTARLTCQLVPMPTS